MYLHATHHSPFTIFSFTFFDFRLRILASIPNEQATGYWRSVIISSEEVLKSGNDLLGVTMDPHSAAIEQDIAFGVGKSDAFTRSGAGVNASLRETAKAVTLTAEAAFDESAPDIELCRLAAAGNLAAFEIIYGRYHRRTYSLCLRMTGSQTEAEDLTQEAFIQLFRKIGSFRGDSAFSTWLHRLTVNQVLMHFRRRSVKNERTSEDGEMPEQMVRGTSNPNRMQVVDRIALKNAIAELPNGYRNVFVLHDVEGFEHEEVARKMGISVGTSKSQLHKARLKLRGLLIKRQD